MNLTPLADPTLLPKLLEATMLLCLGTAWPLANLRMLRNRRAEGLGLRFTALILVGYFAGALARLALAGPGAPLAPVFWLYALNSASVGTNLALQWLLGRRPAPVPLIQSARTSAR
jgi:hypothetical protein